MEKMDGYSLNIVKENVAKLKEIFPEVFCEDKVDFERLQEVLGEYVEDREERYRFEWHGKSKAIRIAQTPSRGTLRPCKEESKNWDTTENLYIEGDNLEVLKLLQKSYQNKIKMIYIDPPYNTGNDFVYKDDYKDNLKNYLEITGQVDEEGKRLSTNSETSGRYHTDWLNMMYPRLRLARNLLKDDGVIFISIDEIEYSKLRQVCDEIFDESNHIADFIWQNKKGGGNDAKYVAVEHEYIVMYAKNEVELHELFEPYKPEYLKRYKEVDSIGYYYWDTFKRKSGKQYYPIECPDGTVLEKDEYGNPISWLRSKERFYDDIKKGEVRIIETAKGWSVQFKQRLPKGKKPRSIFIEESVWINEGTTSVGNQELLKFFGVNLFDNAKPSNLLKKIIGFNLKENDIVLDFFSGSGTLAQAIMEYNFEQNISNKYILVQLQEDIEKKINNTSGDAKKILENAMNFLQSINKNAYITEIAKERIRRAGDKIVEENKDKEGIEDLDIGFKVFKLASSNIKPWNPSYEDIANRLDEMVDNFVPGRTEEDVVYEIMLKYGIDLTYPIEVREVSGKKVFSIGFGALIICLDNEITLDVVNGIVDLKNELNPETTRIVFKDNGFKTDSVKTNAIEILKRNNINENEIMSI
ncbi:site-specific DNA-methyltransferase [Clostridium cochlearium]|uniref:Site-specific DNA-methyltransferase n=1 Tax=Clostridium cochlearium TaxID=1494 RepID=A0A7Y3V4Z6_CLOCO|nr:site-specific DNA-methyltransferase [Clostridium cochlearium]NOH14790.1 site-specific DNA-methyltransferase [Clostridium cochlearium]